MGAYMNKKQKIFYVLTLVVPFLITGPVMLFIYSWCEQSLDIDITIYLLLIYLFLLPIVGFSLGIFSYKILKKVIFPFILMTLSIVISVLITYAILNWLPIALFYFIYPNIFSYITYVVPITALISAAISKLKEKKASKNA